MEDHDPATFGIHLTKQYHIENFRPSDFQWSVTKIADDFTLYDIFKLIDLAERATPGIAKIFGLENFDAFWKQINHDRDPNYDVKPSYIELYWRAECDVKDDLNEEDPAKSELSCLMGCHGVGPGCICNDEHCECPETRGYGIEFTPVNNIAHLPIRVSPNVKFYQPFVKDGNDYRRTGFQLTIYPTLWCLMTSIFWELTFIDSTPDLIEKNSQKIFGKIENIEKQIERSGADISFLEDLP